MAITLGTHVQRQNNGTTATIDTTGASLLVAVVASFGDIVYTVSDSKSNTWVPLTIASVSTTSVGILYVANPTVGTLHTFSLSGAGAPSMFVSAFNGVKLTTPFDQQSTGTNTGTTVQPGSVTPSENNELLICAEADPTSAATTLDGGFSIVEAYTAGGSFESGFLAHLIQTTAAAANPTCTGTGSVARAAAIATFKEAGAATGGGWLVNGALINGRGLATS